MAMSFLMLCWLDDLANKYDFNGKSILEIGPQDIWLARDVVQKVADRRLGVARATDLLDRMYDGANPRRMAVREFYEIFGINEYMSFDVSDKRADYRFDMNFPIPLSKQFDVITNFGTGEHVFDVAAYFNNLHCLLRTGGVCLHVVPAYSDLNHGFYNFNPVLFKMMADANAYEIVDYRYVDNIAYKGMYNQEKGIWDNYSLPTVTIQNMAEYSKLRQVVYRNFLKNSSAPETMAFEAEHQHTVFDYNFVALKKTRDAEFVVPDQGGRHRAYSPNSRRLFLGSLRARLRGN